MEANSYKAGVFAEWIAAFYLMLKGYRIIAWRFKTRVGEIDLIARRGSLLVFVEVKKRKRLEDAAEAITAINQKRVMNAARYFLQNKQASTLDEIRFDAILYDGFLGLRHIKQAFTLS